MVECDLAKVEVAGSNPVSRSRNSSSADPSERGFFDVEAISGRLSPLRNPEPKANDLFQVRRGSQVVRQRSAKPLFGGSIPPRASNFLNHLHHPFSITGCRLAAK